MMDAETSSSPERRKCCRWSKLMYISTAFALLVFSGVGPALYFAGPLHRAVAKLLRPGNICQYDLPMRYNFNTFIEEEFSTKNRPFIESLRNLPWKEPMSDENLTIIAYFKTACMIAATVPRTSCGSTVLVHPYCSVDLTQINLDVLSAWIHIQEGIFVPLVKDKMIILPLNLVWIEYLPEPFRTYAFAGAISAELLLCQDGLTFEMPIFEHLQQDIATLDGNDTSPSIWFPGTAESLYWAFRLHSCCLKEGLEPTETNDFRFFGRLASFVKYIHKIAEPTK